MFYLLSRLKIYLLFPTSTSRPEIDSILSIVLDSFTHSTKNIDVFHLEGNYLNGIFIPINMNEQGQNFLLLYK